MAIVPSHWLMAHGSLKRLLFLGFGSSSALWFGVEPGPKQTNKNEQTQTHAPCAHTQHTRAARAHTHRPQATADTTKNNPTRRACHVEPQRRRASRAFATSNFAICRLCRCQLLQLLDSQPRMLQKGLKCKALRGPNSKPLSEVRWATGRADVSQLILQRDSFFSEGRCGARIGLMVLECCRHGSGLRGRRSCSGARSTHCGLRADSSAWSSVRGWVGFKCFV